MACDGRWSGYKRKISDVKYKEEEWNDEQPKNTHRMSKKAKIKGVKEWDNSFRFFSLILGHLSYTQFIT